jgi:hypothetical protein
MNTNSLPMSFTRGLHHYVLTGACGEDGYIGTRDGAVVARGLDRYAVTRALIVSGTPIKRGSDDA